MKFLIAFLGVFLAVRISYVTSDSLIIRENPSDDVLTECLQHIYEDRAFDTMLIVQPPQLQDCRFEAIFTFNSPRLILTSATKLEYKIMYNSEILAILVVSQQLDTAQVTTLANALDQMRQTRILILAENIKNPREMHSKLLQLCEQYKMTNVVLLSTHSDEELQLSFDVLKPYPNYHWDVSKSLSDNSAYFQPHWRNLHNKTITTYPDQNIGRCFLYKDDEGEWQMVGFVANLILLFAQHFNASLQMYQPLKLNHILHYTTMADMAANETLDIPMSLDAIGYNAPTYTDFVDTGRVSLVVPCALPFTITETFAQMCSIKLFAGLLAITMIFSLVASAIDYVCNGVTHKIDFLLNDKVMLGILGQSYSLVTPRWTSLKQLYLYIGFVGIMISTQYTAILHVEITTPHLHHQIKTFSDIVQSNLKVLVPAEEYQYITHLVKPFAGSVVVSDNASYVIHYRYTFSTKYGFYVTSAGWYYLSSQQKYFSRKVLCTNENMTIFNLLNWAVPLSRNSPYRDPLNALIRRIHELGLFPAWQARTFMQMQRMKNITLRDPNPPIDRKVLDTYDLVWVWLCMAMGLAISCLAFFLELLIYYHPFKSCAKSRQIN